MSHLAGPTDREPIAPTDASQRDETPIADSPLEVLIGVPDSGPFASPL